MFHRTYGETGNCMGCRYWSEMLARSYGGPVEAMCLSGTSPFTGKYTTPGTTCDAWRSGHHGAVDEPPNYGEETRKLYEREEKPEKRKERKKR